MLARVCQSVRTNASHGHRIHSFFLSCKSQGREFLLFKYTSQPYYWFTNTIDY